MPILLVLLIIVFSILSDKFFTPLNLTNILVQNVHTAVCCTGIFMIMVSGGCDLSIGYQMSVAAVIVTKGISTGVLSAPVAILLGIVICALLGTFNGIMAMTLNSHTMIVTLGTMAIFQGISYLISGSKTYHNLPRGYMYLGQGKLFGVIPFNAIIALVIIVIVGIIMTKTKVGRKVYAVGDNPYGPFTYQGEILTPVVGWTTHHAIIQYEGKWYLFHHDSVPSGGKSWLRSLKVCPIEWDANGKIVTIDGMAE